MIMPYKILVLATFLLAGCTVGPDYVRPLVNRQVSYKKEAKNWKVAQPQNIKHKDWI